MDKSSLPYLLHIRDYIALITDYIDNMSLDQFKNDHKTQDAVIRQLEIIEEATSHLEESIKTNFPEISWREIKDFRNVLAHE